ncbi:hypothetical protein GBAR_LOCUS18405 [Geodia barretti]|uniref:Uncharacterized protein n=1 Tax=Geodia barretti TaxID=519541 RepID=A0AA35WZL5_GEOBA|nr:hypothetical protein GBAR_LOCUS18405 [Geodia barretti]
MRYIGTPSGVLYWPLLLLPSTGVGATATHFVFNLFISRCYTTLLRAWVYPLALRHSSVVRGALVSWSRKPSQLHYCRC